MGHHENTGTQLDSLWSQFLSVHKVFMNTDFSVGDTEKPKFSVGDDEKQPSSVVSHECVKTPVHFRASHRKKAG